MRPNEVDKALAGEIKKRGLELQKGRKSYDLWGGNED